MRTIDPETLDEAVRRIVAELSPEGIILFGSQAWGRPDPGSDVDLLIVVSPSDERPSRRAARAHRCLSGIGVPTDLILRTRSQLERFRGVRGSLEAEILDRGVVLYG